MPASAAIRPTILVTEDDEDMAGLLRHILHREGYDIHVAYDGRAAQTLVDTLPPPALVILDVMLPYLSGFQLVTHIRKKPDWASVPIIMLTADSNESHIVRALESGANDYVVKPFQPRELLARVRRLLQRPS
ncbi:MAG: response regulator [Nitrospirae bacterium]|nr:response regulator [Nitrospirota bacterium]